jgi:hypothetical protein
LHREKVAIKNRSTFQIGQIGMEKRIADKERENVDREESI